WLSVIAVWVLTAMSPYTNTPMRMNEGASSASGGPNRFIRFISPPSYCSGPVGTAASGAGAPTPHRWPCACLLDRGDELLLQGAADGSAAGELRDRVLDPVEHGGGCSCAEGEGGDGVRRGVGIDRGQRTFGE